MTSYPVRHEMSDGEIEDVAYAFYGDRRLASDYVMLFRSTSQGRPVFDARGCAEIREFHREGWSMTAIARDYGVSKDVIYNVIHRRGIYGKRAVLREAA